MIFFIVLNMFLFLGVMLYDFVVWFIVINIGIFEGIFLKYLIWNWVLLLFLIIVINFGGL